MVRHGPPARSVAVVSAHVGDFCIRAGGTLALYARAKWPVEVICLSYGERGESPGCWQKGLAEPKTKETRRTEAESAAAVLGVRVEFADWGDQPLVSTKERIEALVKWLRRVRPGILLAHFSRDPWNPDHETAYHMTWQASYFASRAGVPGEAPTPKPHAYLFEPTWPFAVQAGFSPNVYVDISDFIEVKREAIRCLASQPEMVERYSGLAAMRAAEASEGQDLGLRFTEAFYRASPWVGASLPSGDPAQNAEP